MAGLRDGQEVSYGGEGVAKTTVVLGVAQLLSTTIGISGFLHVQAKRGEMLTTLEALRSCLRRAEVDATSAPGEAI